MDLYQQLRELVASAEEDYRKAEGGNKAAGTRVRKIMQEIKTKAQEIRAAMLETRGEEKKAG